VMHVIASVLALALLVSAQPGDKPNFSGEWKLNLEKSNFGALPPPTSMTRKIVHAEPSMTIDEVQVSPLGEQTTTRSYKTDGSAMTFMVNGATVNGSAKWVKNVLEVLSNVETIGMSFTDRMSLSPDGKTLTSAVQVTSAQGNMDMTAVFEKR
jgi:hypothetical protein